jgi:transcriptional regulator with XRE-family HTH domain
MEPKDQSRVAALELAIGARMRTRRRQLGLSQSDLADKLGVSFQQVQKYERGANRVAASTLVAASVALGTTVAWLVGEEASGRDDDEDVFRALSRPGALEILQAFNAINDAPARMALLALVREMAASHAAE